jgi:hypothetical protein
MNNKEGKLAIRTVKFQDSQFQTMEPVSQKLQENNHPQHLGLQRRTVNLTLHQILSSLGKILVCPTLTSLTIITCCQTEIGDLVTLREAQDY